MNDQTSERNRRIEALTRHLVAVNQSIELCVGRAAHDSQAWEQLESLGLEKAQTNEQINALLAEVPDAA